MPTTRIRDSQVDPALLARATETSRTLSRTEINLLKTNFKIDTYRNAVAYRLGNMFIDIFSDQSGIDKLRSNYTFDPTLKAITHNNVVTTSYPADQFDQLERANVEVIDNTLIVAPTSGSTFPDVSKAIIIEDGVERRNVCCVIDKNGNYHLFFESREAHPGIWNIEYLGLSPTGERLGFAYISQDSTDQILAGAVWSGNSLLGGNFIWLVYFSSHNITVAGLQVDDDGNLILERQSSYTAGIGSSESFAVVGRPITEANRVHFPAIIASGTNPRVGWIRCTRSSASSYPLVAVYSLPLQPKPRTNDVPAQHVAIGINPAGYGLIVCPDANGYIRTYSVEKVTGSSPSFFNSGYISSTYAKNNVRWSVLSRPDDTSGFIVVTTPTANTVRIYQSSSWIVSNSAGSPLPYLYSASVKNAQDQSIFFRDTDGAWHSFGCYSGVKVASNYTNTLSLIHERVLEEGNPNDVIDFTTNGTHSALIYTTGIGLQTKIVIWPWLMPKYTGATGNAVWHFDVGDDNGVLQSIGWNLKRGNSSTLRVDYRVSNDGQSWSEWTTIAKSNDSIDIPCRYVEIRVSFWGASKTDPGSILSELWVKTNTGQSVVTSVAVPTSLTPNRAVLAVEYDPGLTGSVSFSLSRDGGSTWLNNIEPNRAYDLSALPEGQSLVLRATIRGDAKLAAWGLSWD